MVHRLQTHPPFVPNASKSERTQAGTQMKNNARGGIAISIMQKDLIEDDPPETHVVNE
jgi:hypothetical protein